MVLNLKLNQGNDEVMKRWMRFKVLKGLDPSHCYYVSSLISSYSHVCRQFRLTNNKKIEELPEGVARELSFQSIGVSDTALKRIHPSVIENSGERLVNLSIENSRLEEFPFGVLSTLHRLKGLWLQNNSLAVVPAIRSDSLELLYLSYNNITRVDADGWATPNMRHLDMSKWNAWWDDARLTTSLEQIAFFPSYRNWWSILSYDIPHSLKLAFSCYTGYNPLSKFPSAMIRSLRKLEEFYCSGCNLGPSLSNGLLNFRSKTLKLVVLWGNDISRLGPKYISGTINPSMGFVTE